MNGVPGPVPLAPAELRVEDSDADERSVEDGDDDGTAAASWVRRR